MSIAPDLNVRADEGGYHCPICGYSEVSSQPAYDAAGDGLIGSAIRPCYLWEPGFDDDPLASKNAKSTVFASIVAYRAKWSDLAEWQGQLRLRPPNFDGTRQLAKL